MTPIYEPEAMELAWAAGFFDGEGNATVDRGKKPYKYLRLQIAHVRPEPLVRFIAAVGVGRLLGPYDRGPQVPNQKPIHRWAVVGRTAESVVPLLWPYLSIPKREQIEWAREQANGEE